MRAQRRTAGLDSQDIFSEFQNMQEFGRFGPAVRVKHQADKVGADTIHSTRGGNQIYYAPNVFGVGGTWEQLALRRAFFSSFIRLCNTAVQHGCANLIREVGCA